MSDRGNRVFVTDATGIDPQFDDPSNHAEGYPPDWEAHRTAVYRRDDYTCRNCGTKSGPHVPEGRQGVRLHAHHVAPKSQGGSNRLDNLVTLCEACHNRVHDITDSMDGDTVPGGGPTTTGTDPPSVAPEVLVFFTYPLYMGAAATGLYWAGLASTAGLSPAVSAVVLAGFLAAFLWIPSRTLAAAAFWTLAWAGLTWLGPGDPAAYLRVVGIGLGPPLVGLALARLRP